MVRLSCEYDRKNGLAQRITARVCARVALLAKLNQRGKAKGDHIAGPKSTSSLRSGDVANPQTLCAISSYLFGLALRELKISDKETEDELFS